MSNRPWCVAPSSPRGRRGPWPARPGRVLDEQLPGRSRRSRAGGRWSRSPPPGGARAGQAPPRRPRRAARRCRRRSMRPGSASASFFRPVPSGIAAVMPMMRGVGAWRGARVPAKTSVYAGAWRRRAGRRLRLAVARLVARRARVPCAADRPAASSQPAPLLRDQVQQRGPLRVRRSCSVCTSRGRSCPSIGPK